MGSLGPVHWRTLKRLFELEGFEVARTRGSHIIMTKPGVARPVVIPRYTEIRAPIIRSNLKTAGISARRFRELLGRIG